jgi:hypothetical protein
MSNLRAIVQTVVENLNDSDLAQAVTDLAGPTCSFCQQESCTHPVHLVLDDLAIELLEEEASKRKEWSAESTDAPAEA